MNNESLSNEKIRDNNCNHIVIQRRYDTLGALNDLLIAIWFLIGSFFFLNESLTYSGTWLFIVGSAQLMIKPIIKLIGLFHIGRVHPDLKRRHTNNAK